MERVEEKKKGERKRIAMWKCEKEIEKLSGNEALRPLPTGP